MFPGAALDGFAAAPFPLHFDRIEERKAVTLRTRKPLAGARAFQKALANIRDRAKPSPPKASSGKGTRAERRR